MGLAEPQTYHILYLEKVTRDGGKPPGTIFRYTYKNTPHGEARGRAARALKREHPHEDVLHWKFVK